MNLYKIITSLVISVFAVFCFSNYLFGADKKLKAVSAFAEGTNFSKYFESFIDKVNLHGKGIISINYIGGGGKVMSPFELGNAVRTKVVDIGNLPGAFYTNLLPEADALKMTSKNVQELQASGAWTYLNQLHNEKVNARLFARQKSKAPFHLYLTRPISDMDLNGFKIRTTPIYRAFFSSMGASLIRTAPGEVFTALERGVVDGYGWPDQGIFDLGWHEVTKYRVDPGFYAAAVEILINKDSWNALNFAQQAVLEKAAREMEIEADGADRALSISELKRQSNIGIKTISFKDSDKSRYLKRANDTAWEAILKSSPNHGLKLKKLLSN